MRIYFPHVQQELWSNSSTLVNSSSYFKSLFDGGYAESDNWVSEPTFISDLGSREDERSFDDSDDEVDDNLEPANAEVNAEDVSTPSTSARANKKKRTTDEAFQSSTIHQFREIVIKSASYTTYYALLSWIESGQISYRPLRSSATPVVPIQPPSSSTPTAPIQLLSTSSHPSASTKSIYRLADFLEIDTLKAHALEALKSSLTVDNIAVELFGDVSIKYQEVQKMELEFALNNWEKVKDTEGMKEIKAKLENDEGSSAMGAVGLKLAMRLK